MSLLCRVNQSLGCGEKLSSVTLIDQSRKSITLEVYKIEDVPKRRKKNQGSFREDLFYDSARSKTVHRGHRKIEHDDVGSQFSCPGDGFLAVGRFSADVPTRLLEHFTQGFPYHSAVIDKEDGLHISRFGEGRQGPCALA